MKKVLAIAVLVVGVAASAFTVPSITVDDQLWFSANQQALSDYGSIASNASVVAADFDENAPLPGQPSISLEPEVGECLQNSDRICSAKFITDTDDVTPLTHVTGQIVQGEYRYQ